MIVGMMIAEPVQARGTVTARRTSRLMEIRVNHMKKFQTLWVWIVFLVALLVTIGFCVDVLAADQWTC